jgi:hypothetical protein
MEHTDGLYYKLENLQEFLKYCFDLMGVKISARGGIIAARKAKVTLNAAYLHYLDKMKDFRALEAKREPNPRHRRFIKEASRPLFDTHVVHYLDVQAQIEEQKFKDSLTYAGHDLSEIDKMVKCLGAKEIERNMIAHWMWLVKSNMFYPQRAKYYPYMLILVSRKQGIGKGTFTREWLRPLAPFSMDTTVDQITDARVQLSMCSHYVVVLDEMARLERTDINALKRVLTMAQTSVRPLYENSVESTMNLTSFLGSSNTRLVESIYDPSGMRRFFEIQLFNCIDFDMVKEIDFQKAWRSIDEHLERGYIEPYIEYLKEEQASYMVSEPFQDFVYETDLNLDGDKKEINSSVLYKLYTKWCAENYYNHLAHQTFSRKLIGVNIKSKHKKNGNVFLINANSPLWEQEDATMKELEKEWIR